MNFLSKLRFQKPAPEKTKLTQEQGRAIAETTVRTLFTDGGLAGFFVAAVSEPGGSAGDVVFSAAGQNHGVTQGIQRLLEILLTSPQTHEAVMQAILAALRNTGNLVETDEPFSDNCNCDKCKRRRSLDEDSPRISKPH